MKLEYSYLYSFIRISSFTLAFIGVYCYFVQNMIKALNFANAMLSVA